MLIPFTPRLTRHLQAEVFAKVEELFKDAPDLSSAFRDFLPASGATDGDSFGALRRTSARTGTPSGEHARAPKRKQPVEPAPATASVPAKRRRRAPDNRDKEKERDSGRATGSRVSELIHTHSGSWVLIL